MAEFLLTRPPRGRVIAVMVAWNGKAFLEAAVTSVLRELTDEDDLLVVENGSTDGSFEFLRARFPEVAVLRTGENLGGAGGFAAGVRVTLKDGGCRLVAGQRHCRGIGSAGSVDGGSGKGPTGSGGWFSIVSLR